MSREIWIRSSVWASFALMVGATAPVTAEVSRLAITVRVYQTAGLTPAVEEQALEEAGSVLGIARVEVTWVDCTGGHAASCGVPPRGVSELLLALVAINQLWTIGPDTLGTAQLANDGSGGRLATVHVRRVQRLAAAAGVDEGVLLGRVVAHEIGHLLIGAHSHSASGLMRPDWTIAQIRKRRSADWRFTSESLAAMRRSERPSSPAPGITP